MTAAAIPLAARRSGQALTQSIPLYVASALVTLTGIGAVGSTLTSDRWTLIWSTAVILGHSVSYFARAVGWGGAAGFWPIMACGCAAVVTLSANGHPLSGLDSRLSDLQSDAVVAVLIATIAMVRCFTLFGTGALRFSPVPAITMLALTGSSNVNVEIPVFFTLLLLGSAFLQVYATHLDRAERRGQPVLPLGLQGFAVWVLSVSAAVAGLLFPVAVQPLLGPYSPFFLPGMARLQGLLNFTQADSRTAPVGAGPITLNATPVYEVYTTETVPIRTAVFTRYNGRSWNQAELVQIRLFSSRELGLAGQQGLVRRKMHEIHVPRTPPSRGVVTRRVRQVFRTVGPAADGIPSAGEAIRLEYPQSYVDMRDTGALVGSAHRQMGRRFTVEAEVREYPAQVLRRAPPIPPTFGESEPESLRVPPAAEQVRQLAERLAANIPGQYDRIQAFMAHMNRTCTYTLEEAITPQGEDAAAYFLFVTRRGACDLAATSLALMCRSVGIPARVAVGYLTDEPLESGNGYLARQLHGHMWTEVYFEDFGWVPFDPTPGLGLLRRNPLQVAFFRLRNALGRFGSGGLDSVLLVSVLALSGVGVVRMGGPWLRARRARRRRRGDRTATPEHEVVESYSRALQSLRKLGWARPEWMTAREYAAHLRSAWGAERSAQAALRALDELTALCESARYAGEVPPGSTDRARHAAEALRRGAPPAPRRPRVPSAQPASQVQS